MRRQEFIDSLYKAGWRCPCDAQWTGAKALHAKLFPDVAALEDEVIEALKDGFMAGQQDCGVDPSYSSAKRFAIEACGYDND